MYLFHVKEISKISNGGDFSENAFHLREETHGDSFLVFITHIAVNVLQAPKSVTEDHMTLKLRQFLCFSVA